MMLSVDEIRAKLLEMGVSERVLNGLENGIQMRALYTHESMHRLMQHRLATEKALDLAVAEFQQEAKNIHMKAGLGAEHSYEILLGVCENN